MLRKAMTRVVWIFEFRLSCKFAQLGERRTILDSHAEANDF